MIARKAVLVRWTSELHRAMQTEIGQQLRSEYELPQELSPELVRAAGQVSELCARAPPEVTSLVHVATDRRRKRLLRALACGEAAGKALNESIKEIHPDLAAQWGSIFI